MMSKLEEMASDVIPPVRLEGPLQEEVRTLPLFLDGFVALHGW